MGDPLLPQIASSRTAVEDERLNDGREGVHVRTVRSLVGTAIGPSVSITLVVGLGLVGPQPVSASGPTLLTSCSFAALDSAVSGGGTIDYQQNCTGGSTVVFPTEILFKGTADIEANGFGVTFSGANSTRFFQLTGGRLTISGVTMHGGEETGQSGSEGTSGQPGTNGANGAPGSDSQRGAPDRVPPGLTALPAPAPRSRPRPTVRPRAAPSWSRPGLWCSTTTW
jgi:hypothetical protein